MSVVLLSLLLIFELIQQAVSGEFHVAFEHFERETFYCLASTFYLKILKMHEAFRIALCEHP